MVYAVSETIGKHSLGITDLKAKQEHRQLGRQREHKSVRQLLSFISNLLTLVDCLILIH